MVSGIFLKYRSDRNFYASMHFLPELSDDIDKRILTFTDIAPAFIFLLFGYIVSFIALISEILLRKKNANQSKEFKKVEKRKSHPKISV